MPPRAGRVALLLALLGAAGCSPGSSCPHSCPKASMTAVVVVSASGGGDPTGVEATLTGPVTTTLDCVSNFGAEACQWSGSGAPGAQPVPFTEGTYSLHVTAPGFQPATTTVTMSIVPDPECGCAAGHAEPAEVKLERAP